LTRQIQFLLKKKDLIFSIKDFIRYQETIRHTLNMCSQGVLLLAKNWCVLHKKNVLIIT